MSFPFSLPLSWTWSFFHSRAAEENSTITFRENRVRSRTETTINDRCTSRDLRGAWRSSEHFERGWRRPSICPKVYSENGRRLFRFERDRSRISRESRIGRCELTWWTKWHVTLFVTSALVFLFLSWCILWRTWQVAITGSFFPEKVSHPLASLPRSSYK